MTHTFIAPTFPAETLFDLIDASLDNFLCEPQSAVAGDFCGFEIEMKSEWENGTCHAFPIDRFIVSLGNGAFEKRSYADLAVEQRVPAALLAMHANLMHLHHEPDLQPILVSLDDQDGPLYIRLLVLPDVILAHRENFESFMEIDLDQPEAIQEDIERHFAVMRRKRKSNHDAMRWHEIERWRLAVLSHLVPIFADSAAPCGAKIQIAFDEQYNA